MAKDDYHVIAYRILIYLYECLKKGIRPDLEYLQYNTKAFPVGESYWYYILSNLYQEGYLTGVILIPILGSAEKGVKLTGDIMITPAGIEYIQENGLMQKAKNFLKELKEIVPGL